MHPFSLYVCTSSCIFCKNQTSTPSSHRLALQWQKPTAEVMVAQQCTDLLLGITQQRDGDHMINNVNSKGVASDPWCPLTNHPIWFAVSGEQPNICRTSRVLRSIRLLFANDTNVVQDFFHELLTVIDHALYKTSETANESTSQLATLHRQDALLNSCK